MGLFYSSITIKIPTQAQVLAHLALVQALRLPAHCAGVGYYTIAGGHVPGGVDRARILKTP